ncbi:PREDICTED: vegetative incompatibility protein HET-E-1-like isoform X2 [Ipomoea nil]|uniref:vegetative incompatibility protein HET-E-1-like isoform X2 n=1 Tax=Ipomoea nil TaxID=35883 RepID=UPI0009016145|nr:PREDICTED: vegetative incompatibility protein HET-E-1-like isoform X2 [Ipomoea nil]
MTSYDQPSSSNEEIFAENASTSIHSRCVATLKSHNSYTSSLVLAGKFLFTGSSDKEIRMWKRRADHENPTNDDVVVVVAGKGAVKSLVVSAGDKIFSAHQDNKIRVWKINNHHNSDTQTLAHLATLPILSDRAIKYLRPKNHVQIRRHKTSTWVHHVDAVSALALSQDESLLYSVSWDRTLKIWSTPDFKCIQSIENAHDDAINALAASRDGRVYTGSADKKIKVWGKPHGGEKNHSLVATLEKHSSGINALAVDMNGSVLYSGSSDRTILVWENDCGGGGGRTVAALRGHKKAILCLGVVADLVCSGSADKTIRIWRRGVERCYSCVAVLAGHDGPVKCLTAASDCHHEGDDETSSYLLYSGGLDGDTKVWEIFVLR